MRLFATHAFFERENERETNIERYRKTVRERGNEREIFKYNEESRASKQFNGKLMKKIKFDV